ncbi:MULTISPECIES: excinuclease ABC subunit UvrC [Legionella]|uniref:UvrABC system protein C n=1 Tax=Legionella septentrionalis TaxID=2498109 RepID=A0A433JLQ3_9GAMM|nr:MULTISPECIES: excinuclease ABC subunit UvrC [Legionella]MCP0914093.1 excinuclease ABC subunit UvrC [Legionella sp. 27cVA30]RUQ90747.1 excinuclease ABC subunit UvrC [Legionella septentrionalis]RUQ99948.1 excinuclease ABC subunit UvrC [Legionella septentrionalis]RUR10208.1 excinuclease ABC subunit UvrC [Legionella septentrionalis]RUR15780.1 excinuclease ABC subunit UvrC [Legionella septentrionalis]
MNKRNSSIDLGDFLASLTPKPGVYRMLDAQGQVLYVGKAANLKKRVSSYFNKNNSGVKTRSLISQIAAIEVSITRSETEALLLESSLIKSLRPKYNVLLRDDKSYPYIHVNHHIFPRMEFLRVKKKPKKGQFFGPYPSAAAVRETLGVIQKVFKIRNCSDNYFNGRSRPCLQFQIKRCSAPCVGNISREDYQQSVDDATRFLQGKCQLILSELEQRMENAVSKLEFEEAARLRDQIKSLRLIQEQQGVIQLRGDADVIVIDARPGFACVQWVTVRDGQILASQSFFPSIPEQGLIEDEHTSAHLWQQVFSAFIAYFYIDTPERIPSLILTDHDITEQGALEDMLGTLRGKACKIQANPRGIKARWLDFARQNLQVSVLEQTSSTQLLADRYEALRQLLNMPEAIERMECFDVSHTQGEATVASCVVFNQQGPAKNEYRRFNITGITAGDDYTALEQAITRRFKKLTAEQNLPSLLIIDGGKGQVAVAKRVLESFQINSVKLLGIAKGPTRKAGWEQLILADEAREITAAPASPALHLLQHIRDEAHRFAITLHRKKRQKARLDSSLESIEGIGAKRRQALLRRFGGLRELTRAPVEEIAKVQGISRSLAERIYQHLHN